MHPSLNALIELHKINEDRQLLRKRREQRESQLATATAAWQRLADVAAEARKAVTDNDALIRQYTADVERCDATIAELRGKQMEAKTNKEYLAILNGVEKAKNEKTIRQESLKNLKAEVEELEQKAAAAEAAADKEKEARDTVELDQATQVNGDVNEAELDRLYHEAKKGIDPMFLSTYERLIASGNKMPLMPVSMKNQATPFGTRISLNQITMILRGELITDPTTNAILYVTDLPKESSKEA